MKQFLLSFLDRPFPGTLIGRLGGFLRHRPTVMGMTNPLYVSHYFVDRQGTRYLARAGTHLARQSTPDQIVRFNLRHNEPETAVNLLLLPRRTDMKDSLAVAMARGSGGDPR